MAGRWWQGVVRRGTALDLAGFVATMGRGLTVQFAILGIVLVFSVLSYLAKVVVVRPWLTRAAIAVFLVALVRRWFSGIGPIDLQWIPPLALGLPFGGLAYLAHGPAPRVDATDAHCEPTAPPT